MNKTAHCFYIATFPKFHIDYREEEITFENSDCFMVSYGHDKLLKKDENFLKYNPRQNSPYYEKYIWSFDKMKAIEIIKSDLNNYYSELKNYYESLSSEIEGEFEPVSFFLPPNKLSGIVISLVSK